MFWVFKSCLMYKILTYESVDRVVFLIHDQVGRDVTLERQHSLNSVHIQVYLLVHSFI